MKTSRDLSPYLVGYIGKSVEQIYRVVFEHQDAVNDWHKGTVEFVFNNDAILQVFDIDGGERLSADNVPWVDSFVADDVQDQLFIEQYGKWTKVDVSEREPFRRLMGRALSGFTLFNSCFGSIAGLELVFDQEMVTIYAIADECYVIWGAARAELERLGFTPSTPT